MNYRLMVRYYHGPFNANVLQVGVYHIGDAIKMQKFFSHDESDTWLEPTEDKVYRVWCRDYRYHALVYDLMMPPTDIKRATDEIALMRMTQRVGEAGCDYWIEEVCDGDGR